MKFPLHCYWNQLWSLSAPQHTKWTPPTTTSGGSGGSGGGVVVVVVFVCSCNTASSVCLLSLWKHEALGECRVVFFPLVPCQPQSVLTLLFVSLIVLGFITARSALTAGCISDSHPASAGGSRWTNACIWSTPETGETIRNCDQCCEHNLNCRQTMQLWVTQPTPGWWWPRLQWDKSNLYSLLTLTRVSLTTATTEYSHGNVNIIIYFVILIKREDDVSEIITDNIILLSC